MGEHRLIEYLELVSFIDSMMNSSNNAVFKEKIKVYFFNKLLIGCFQEDILNLKKRQGQSRILWTSLQYFIETFDIIKNPELKWVICGFFVGFTPEELEKQQILLRDITNTPSKSAAKEGMRGEICLSPMKECSSKKMMIDSTLSPSPEGA